MLPFQKAALLDLVSTEPKSGTLMVMARGLGLDTVLSNVVSCLSNPHGLVLVLGLHDSDLESLPIPTLNSTTTPRKRQELYETGHGVMACTARVLLVDLLQGRIEPRHITGIIINHADEHVEEHGVIAFILAICKRQPSAKLFVKALTDRPEQFLSGVSGLERAMRSLQLRTCSFYPRFKDTVRQDLDGAAVDVVEIKVGLGREAKSAQVLLLDLITRSLKHLITHTLLDPDQFTVDLALSNWFDRRLFNYLDLNYRTIDTVTADLLQEIKTWRQLLFLNINCVNRQDFNDTFKELMNQACQDAANVPSWAITDSAELLLRQCKGQCTGFVNPKISAIVELQYEEEELLVVTSNELLYNELVKHQDGERTGVKRQRKHSLLVEFSDSPWMEKFISSPSRALCLTDLTLEQIRQVEVAVAKSKPTTPRRLYYLMFTESAEEQRYLAGLRREKEAFERLISSYGDLPEWRDLEPDLLEIDTDKPGRFSSLLDEDREDSSDMLITIDVRELRSALPFVLYKRNYTILPLTLITGDYIPANGVCVERKTVPDLIGSLNNGRLLSQTERMLTEYNLSCLLVELDSFKRSPWEGDHVIGKLAVLLHQRPALRMLWAGGPAAAADLLHDLIRAGSGSDTNRDTPKGNYSMVGRNALLGLRGIIDERNVQLVMEEFVNLRDVMTADRQRMKKVLGEECGERLYKAVNNL